MKHKKCGFRDRVKVCGFKAEDCNAKECDMYEIDFKSKEILKTSKQLRKEIIRLHEEMQQMKKERRNKSEKEKYDALKKERNDKVHGMAKLAKAYVYAKRTKL